MSAYRQPAVAGLFYSAGYWKLKKEIQQFFDNVTGGKNFDNIIGIISPHAGYIYSGQTAAYAYSLLKGKNFNNIIIISPSHREYFPGISIYDGDGYETPLGKIPVNKELTCEITKQSKIIFKGKEGHGSEHGIEVQLPFLQCVFEDFKIVPIVMGDQSKMFIDELAEKLSTVVNEETLLIASSDLSHYYPVKEANQKDTFLAEKLSQFKFEELYLDFQNKKCEACGAGPILAVMKTASLINRRKSVVLHRSNSGDVSGDYNEVVGYLSAVIYGE